MTFRMTTLKSLSDNFNICVNSFLASIDYFFLIEVEVFLVLGMIGDFFIDNWTCYMLF